MAFRPVGLNPQYLTLSGSSLTVLAGGTLTFYATGTTTPKDTFSDVDLAILNPNPVTLDAEGRPETDIWGSGSYTVLLKDSDGATIWTRDDVLSDSDVPDQTGHNGQFLTTSGTGTDWTAIDQLPDQTGSAGKWLKTDGVNAAWNALDLSAGAFASMAGWLCKNMQEVIQTVTVSGATTNIDLSLGGIVELVHTLDTTLTFSNSPSVGRGLVVTIIRIKDASATSRALTLPSGKKNAGGVAPTLTQTTGAQDIFSVLVVNGATVGAVNYWSGTSAYA